MVSYESSGEQSQGQGKVKMDNVTVIMDLYTWAGPSQNDNNSAMREDVSGLEHTSLLVALASYARLALYTLDELQEL